MNVWVFTAATVNYRAFTPPASTGTAKLVLFPQASTWEVFGNPALHASHARGVADLDAGRYKIFDDVESLLRDLDE